MKLRGGLALALAVAAAGSACDPGTLDALGSAETGGSPGAGSGGSSAAGTAGAGGTDAGGGDAGSAAGSGTGGIAGTGGTGGIAGTGGAGGIAGTGGAGGGAATIGATCATSSDCAAGLFCLDAKGVGGGPGQTSICTRGCCTSGDCGSSDAVCWTSPMGANVCRLASVLGRGQPGSGAAGDPCNLDSQCRSGWCTNGSCTDLCCLDDDCPSLGAAKACAFTPTAQGQTATFSCEDPGTKTSFGAPCNAGSDCTSGLCATLSGFSFCTKPCCSSTDCGMLQGFDFFCTYDDMGGNQARLCMAVTSSGGAATGTPCTQDDDCRSHICLTENGQSFCSDACCQDSDCGDATLGCRPVSDSSHPLGLRCVPL